MTINAVNSPVAEYADQVQVDTLRVVGLISEELGRARRKFPSSYACMCALTEEVGELAKALMDEPWEFVVREAVQVACMAIRVATERDPSLQPIRDQRGSDK